MQLHMQADGMNSKGLVGLLVLILLVSSFSCFNYFENCSASSVLPKFYVDDDYDNSTPGWQVDHFAVIQDAINVSSAGDRIVVYAGTYYETITISHQLDIFGEDRDITKIDGGNSGDVIIVNAANVNISHFTIKNSGSVSNNSGIANIGQASQGGRGTISAGSLEMSNVDLSEQFTDMIITQRGFQANSRTITTSDQMLQELINLKR